jgi:hypothetical protein
MAVSAPAVKKITMNFWPLITSMAADYITAELWSAKIIQWSDGLKNTITRLVSAFFATTAIWQYLFTAIVRTKKTGAMNAPAMSS